MAENRFNRAVSIIQNMPRDGPVKPTDDDRLYFYKYFKQATQGDIPADLQRPGLFDFEGKAKWDAWNSVKGTPKEKCWEEYTKRLEELLKRHESTDFAKDYINQLNAA